jgi:hypothetical protein
MVRLSVLALPSELEFKASCSHGAFFLFAEMISKGACRFSSIAAGNGTPLSAPVDIVWAERGDRASLSQP